MTAFSGSCGGSGRRDFLRGVAAAAVVGGGLLRTEARGEPQEGKALFDGKTLTGWHAVPRATPEQWARFKTLKAGGEKPSPKDEVFLANMTQSGSWAVDGGAIVGGQDQPGSGRGSYLVSDATFADFELELEANPDWPVDTGIMVRCLDIGSVGYQVLVDHRPNGCIGGFFGNGIGSFRAFPFILDADTTGPVDGIRRPTKFRAGVAPDGVVTKPRYAATVDDFRRAWKPGDWNTFRIRCVGAVPLLTTWVNGVKIAELDASRFEAPGYDAKEVASRLGREGHLAFEVHNNDPRMGKDRWWPGAVCRLEGYSYQDDLNRVSSGRVAGVRLRTPSGEAGPREPAGEGRLDVLTTGVRNGLLPKPRR